MRDAKLALFPELWLPMFLLRIFPLISIPMKFTLHPIGSKKMYKS